MASAEFKLAIVTTRTIIISRTCIAGLRCLIPNQGFRKCQTCQGLLTDEIKIRSSRDEIKFQNITNRSSETDPNSSTNPPSLSLSLRQCFSFGRSPLACYLSSISSGSLLSSCALMNLQEVTAKLYASDVNGEYVFDLF